MSRNVNSLLAAVLAGAQDGPFKRLIEMAEENIDVAVREFAEEQELDPADTRQVLRLILLGKWASEG